MSEQDQATDQATEPADAASRMQLFKIVKQVLDIFSSEERPPDDVAALGCLMVGAFIAKRGGKTTADEFMQTAQIAWMMGHATVCATVGSATAEEPEEEPS